MRSKMIKRTLGLLLAVVLVCSAAAFSAAAADVSVTVDGYAVSFDPSTGYPYTAESGTVMIPVNRTMAVCGVRVSSDPVSGDCLLQLGTKEIRLASGSAEVVVNGSVVEAVEAPVTIGGILYAPTYEVVTGLGGYVTWTNTRLDIQMQTADSAMVRLQQNAALDWPEQNEAFGAANWARQNGSYAYAAAQYEKCIPGFAGNPTNLAICYGLLGECYARFGAYDRAAAAYNLSAQNWTAANAPDSAAVSHANDLSVRADLSLYLKTSELSLSKERTHGVSYEPQYGTVLGYTTRSFGYLDRYPSSSAKQAGMWLLYYNWGSSSLSDTLSGVPNNVVVELGVQPLDGVNAVTDSEIVSFAQELHTCGKKVMVRYANEMNDPTSPWFTTPKLYKAAYTRFAKILRFYAPEVPMIWAPNDFPLHTIDSYYPGDAYVDYVGASCYIFSYQYSDAEKQAGYDVFGTGMKVQRWSRQLDELYHHYGYKKPFIISEGGASYVDRNTGAVNVQAAAKQIRDFYTYAAIRYPNLKYAVYFNTVGNETNFTMTDHPELMQAYNTAIQDERYLSSCTASAPCCYVPLDTFNLHQIVPHSRQQLCAYVNYADPAKVAAVRYEINGRTIGTATEMPYVIDCDFAQYFGTLRIRASALDASGNVLFSRVIGVSVGRFADVDSEQYYAPAVGWAVGKVITNGTGPYTFSPDAACTRAQVATFLWRASGCPQPSGASNPFSDVHPDAYYHDAVLWAYEQGITVGTGPATFSPDAGCTRAQVVTFLHRARGLPAASVSQNPFWDVPNGMYYYNAVMWAVGKGVTTGTSASTFSPDTVCTRGQIVTFLYRDLK